MTCFVATNNPGSENGLFWRQDGADAVLPTLQVNWKRPPASAASGEHDGLRPLLVFNVVVVVVIWVRPIGCSPQQDLKRLRWRISCLLCTGREVARGMTSIQGFCVWTSSKWDLIEFLWGIMTFPYPISKLFVSLENEGSRLLFSNCKQYMVKLSWQHFLPWG